MTGTRQGHVGAGAMSRRFLFLTVFTGGMTTLAVEFTTSRMIQTVYGTSNLVWANVIGLVLLFLTTGYFVGGRWADRTPSARSYATLLAAAGLASIFFLLLTSAILKSAAAALANLNAGAVVGSLFGVALALALPITLLGMISPFAIRLGVRDVGEAGRISGQVYAISTLGSLAGTYLPTLFLIPLAGTRWTAVIFGSILALTGLLGLWQTGRRRALLTLAAAAVLVPAGWWISRGPLKNSPGHIFETESAYNYIEVIRREGCTYLLLNEGQAYHSYACDGGRIPRVSVWEMMLAAPFFTTADGTPAVRRVAVIGLAAGTIPHRFWRLFPEAAVDGIEIDPAIVAAGSRFFDLDDPRLTAIIGDGRYEFNRLAGPYDVVTIDAYRVPYIPWHLTTREFFAEVGGRLAENGVLAVNVGRVPGDRRLIEALSGTLQAVFPSVHTIDVPGTLNTILVATARQTSADAFLAHRDALPENRDPLLQAVLDGAAAGLVPTVAAGPVFTDDRAPVETIVDTLVIRYLLESGFGSLPTIQNR